MGNLLVVYKATLQETGHFYVGITEMEFKKRLAKHTYSFRNESDKNSTSLSHFVWSQNQAPRPNIKWEILKQSRARKPGDKECILCLEDKLEILKQNKNPLIFK